MKIKIFSKIEKKRTLHVVFTGYTFRPFSERRNAAITMRGPNGSLPLDGFGYHVSVGLGGGDRLIDYGNIRYGR